jgi:hypothetical protein
MQFQINKPFTRHSRESGNPLCGSLRQLKKYYERDNRTMRFLQSLKECDAQSLLAAGKKLGMTAKWLCFVFDLSVKKSVMWLIIKKYCA